MKLDRSWRHFQTIIIFYPHSMSPHDRPPHIEMISIRLVLDFLICVVGTLDDRVDRMKCTIIETYELSTCRFTRGQLSLTLKGKASVRNNMNFWFVNQTSWFLGMRFVLKVLCGPIFISITATIKILIGKSLVLMIGNLKLSVFVMIKKKIWSVIYVIGDTLWMWGWTLWFY